MSSRIGVYLGRFQPLHNMHEHVIKQVIDDFGYENSILIIGSAHTQNEKNVYSLETRREMIKNVFPKFKNIYALDDYYDDIVWLNKFISILKEFDKDIVYSDVVIYCGSYDDVSFFKKIPETSQFQFKCFNRDLSAISATKIRNAINNNDIEYIKANVNIRNFNIIMKMREK